MARCALFLALTLVLVFTCDFSEAKSRGSSSRTSRTSSSGSSSRRTSSGGVIIVGSSGSGYGRSTRSGSTPSWVGILIFAVMVVMGLALLFYCCCYKRRNGRVSAEGVNCYLCGRQGFGEGSEWNSHRRSCASEYAARLQAMPMMPGLGCTTCKQPMRMVPPGPNPKFDCDSTRIYGTKSQGCQEILINNNGRNRFSCYNCDRDLCGICVKVRLGLSHQDMGNRVNQMAGQNQPMGVQPQMQMQMQPQQMVVQQQYPVVQQQQMYGNPGMPVVMY